MIESLTVEQFLQVGCVVPQKIPLEHINKNTTIILVDGLDEDPELEQTLKNSETEAKIKPAVLERKPLNRSQMLALILNPEQYAWKELDQVCFMLTSRKATSQAVKKHCNSKEWKHFSLQPFNDGNIRTYIENKTENVSSIMAKLLANRRLHDIAKTPVFLKYVLGILLDDQLPSSIKNQTMIYIIMLYQVLQEHGRHKFKIENPTELFEGEPEFKMFFLTLGQIAIDNLDNIANIRGKKVNLGKYYQFGEREISKALLEKANFLDISDKPGNG